MALKLGKNKKVEEVNTEPLQRQNDIYLTLNRHKKRFIKNLLRGTTFLNSCSNLLFNFQVVMTIFFLFSIFLGGSKQLLLNFFLGVFTNASSRGGNITSDITKLCLVSKAKQVIF